MLTRSGDHRRAAAGRNRRASERADQGGPARRLFREKRMSPSADRTNARNVPTPPPGGGGPLVLKAQFFSIAPGAPAPLRVLARFSFPSYSAFQGIWSCPVGLPGLHTRPEAYRAKNSSFEGQRS